MPSFGTRLWLAITCFFKLLFDAPFAARVIDLRKPPPPPPSRDRATLPAKPSAITAMQLSRNESALHFLAMLQREGRLIDFCMEDVGGFSDAQIGAAARGVHAGVKKAIAQAFALAPIRLEPEGSAVSIPGGFDPGSIRLTGNIVGEPPFKGVLRHHGWRVTSIPMPQSSADPTILAPAEVELP